MFFQAITPAYGAQNDIMFFIRHSDRLPESRFSLIHCLLIETYFFIARSPEGDVANLGDTTFPLSPLRELLGEIEDCRGKLRLPEISFAFSSQ